MPDVSQQLAGEQPTPTAAPNLPADVDAFIAILKEKYPERLKTRAMAFKRRVVRLIAVRLPPYPKPAGRPRQPQISRAADLYRKQVEDVRRRSRQQVNWLPIAQECIPGFHRANHYRRLSMIRTLRNAVYARLKRIRAKKLSRRSSGRKAPAADYSPPACPHNRSAMKFLTRGEAETKRQKAVEFLRRSLQPHLTAET